MSDEDCLADLLLTWEESFERGEDIPAERLCQDRPDLAATLAARILALKKNARMKAPVGGGEEIVTDRLPRREGGRSAGEQPNPPPMLTGRYRLDMLIGEGGFGQVWRGFDIELQRLVAVKVPKRSCLVGEDREQAFLAEARKAARLKHSGIVPVYDVGRHGASYFIVSELIDGIDLGERMRRGRLPVREAVRIVAAVAYALNYAHRQGIVHRDIKPANVLLGEDGQVRLTDFGIALDRVGAAKEEEEVWGTLAYMSPEQVGGNPGRVDGRSDIYSLGVMLYELVTGVRPPPPLRAGKEREPAGPFLSAVIPPLCLSEVLHKCMAKEPAGRYATAGELAEHLRQVRAVVLEEEWAVCTDPLRMLAMLHDYASERKLRLFLCACVRRGFPMLEDPRSRLALEVAERHADGQTTDGELWAAREAAWEARDERRVPQSYAVAWAADPEIWKAVFTEARYLEPSLQCDLLRELFGLSVYRSITLHPIGVTGKGGSVRSIAQGIYEDRAFERMPILADALEESGCDDSQLLGHCRQPGPHVRGCWVVDALLGKK